MQCLKGYTSLNLLLGVLLFSLPYAFFHQTAIAQTPDFAQGVEIPAFPPQDIPRPLPPQPEPQPIPTPLPPPEDLLPTPSTPQPLPEIPGDIPTAVFVREFEVIGSTVFSPKQLAEVLKEFTGKNLTFAELLQARSAITQLYINQGYVTSAAIIPPQTIDNGVVKIQVIEGTLEDIQVTGTSRLNSSYVSSRIRRFASSPLNTQRLLEGLRLLQLDPLLQNISADLQAGTRPGSSLLVVNIVEAKTLNLTLLTDNLQTPSVGSNRRRIEFTQANLLGLGDELSVAYTNTDGSNGGEFNYIIPLNPLDGTLRFSYGIFRSGIIEPPFDTLDIDANSQFYEISYRQPLYKRVSEEFALGLTLSREENQTFIGADDIGAAPLTPGADEDGRTRISAIRFFQDWVNRNERQVIAARSQFSLGLGLFDATVNAEAPDSRFFAWRGQAQWTRLLARDTLFLVRGDIQIADRPLVPLEQFGIGGQQTVRGYRQDALLTDNGILFSTEFRLPLVRVPRVGGVLQLAPFFDLGRGWNNSGENPDPSTLAGIGLGVLWQQGDLIARLDYGVPLISIDSEERTLQEQGIYFVIRYSPRF